LDFTNTAEGRSSGQATPWRKKEIERKPSEFRKLANTQQPEAMSRRRRTRREQKRLRPDSH
jgi:hypothetical protein